MLTPLEVLKLYPPHGGTLASMLRSRAAVANDREFIVYQGRSYTYAQVLEEVRRAAAVLVAKGVKEGDRVGVMSLNHPSSVFAFFALAGLGAVMVPVNPDYGVEEARYVLNHAEVCGVICSEAALPTVQAACEGLASMPWLMLSETAFVDVPDSLAAAPEPLDNPDATCVFIYTSGTTGFPKGVMHSQRSLLTAGEGFVARMHLQPDDRLLCVLPLFHINAIFYSLAGSLAAGATLILEPKFSASKFWQTVKETGATEVNTIAAASSILMRRPRSEYVPGHRLQKIYGAPFDEETFRVFQDEFHVATLIEGYGMSEIPGALNNPFPGPHKVRSMGQPSRHPDPAVSLAELRIAGDDGQFLPPGQVGELVVRTPIVMQGYFRDEAQTRAAFRDGWFLTGDLAYVDEDNFFWFVARKKDIIRKRGENISGAELDRVIGNHPSVLEAAAIPVPSELGEDEILVAVVLRPGMTLAHEEIAQWCRERLAAIKVPRYVALVDSLPHTPTHRVAKFKMREDASLRAKAVDLQAVTS
ncbi:AMP-binding protein [Polaromonas sp. YR568]|uniref:AMP-binding protein n=1 Tax=Polaromonas sp. YR568 TaxID=1855301 RepID=UPI00398BF356